MKKFLTRLALFSIAGLAAFLLVVAGYIYYDPFRVLRTYHDYSYPHVIGNREYISTEMFLKNNSKYHYNSFILGSSRTMAYKPDSWKQYLPPGAQPFCFDASGETIYGIYIKLRFLDHRQVPLRNLLLIFDRDDTFNSTFPAKDRSAEHLYINHPLLSGGNAFTYHLTFFKAYLTSKFLLNFYDYTWFGRYRSGMKGFLVNSKVRYDTITNEQAILDQEYEISHTPSEYYQKRKSIFYGRPEMEIRDSIQRIRSVELGYLKSIKKILEKNNSNYKIVLSPLYEQLRFNANDLTILNELFPGHVYDFSGKNAFTDEKTNYYEQSHYRPQVGDSILNFIYHHPPPPENF